MNTVINDTLDYCHNFSRGIKWVKENFYSQLESKKDCQSIIINLLLANRYLLESETYAIDFEKRDLILKETMAKINNCTHPFGLIEYSLTASRKSHPSVYICPLCKKRMTSVTEFSNDIHLYGHYELEDNEELNNLQDSIIEAVFLSLYDDNKSKNTIKTKKSIFDIRKLFTF